MSASQSNALPDTPKITLAHVQRAREQARQNGSSMLESLEHLCALDPREFVAELAALFGMPVADHQDLYRWTPAFDLVPLPKAIQRGCVVFHAEIGLVAAIADPMDLDLINWLETVCRVRPHLYCTLRADLHAFLSRHEDSASAMDELLVGERNDVIADDDIEDLSLVSVTEDTSPAVRVVNSTLYDAMKGGASDIHFERTARGLTIKYRVDGVLDAVSEMTGVEMAERVLSRIKVMAELDISERRVPQDGRFKVSARGRVIDVRISIMPGIHGEDAVLRLLDKQTIVPEGSTLSLDLLGFDAGSLTTIRTLVRQPYGMLLVTGPTGSGKTTTLYGALSEINLGRDKIITIEDPVEYELQGVLQIPVNEKKGLTFARGLRSILRHDPDKIMVGEIRDAETGEIAVQSALTGHLVFSTVHANNVFDVFSRFTHMGIDPYALTSALNGVWAQRLMRKVCQRCAKTYVPSAEELHEAGIDPRNLHHYSLLKGEGCGDCRGTGYRGRLAIAEVLVMNDRIRQMVATRQPIQTIKEESRRTGTRYLREAALDLAREGATTLEEVCRVTLQE